MRELLVIGAVIAMAMETAAQPKRRPMMTCEEPLMPACFKGPLRHHTEVLACGDEHAVWQLQAKAFMECTRLAQEDAKRRVKETENEFVLSVKSWSNQKK